MSLSRFPAILHDIRSPQWRNLAARGGRHDVSRPGRHLGALWLDSRAPGARRRRARRVPACHRPRERSSARLSRKRCRAARTSGWVGNSRRRSTVERCPRLRPRDRRPGTRCSRESPGRVADGIGCATPRMWGRTQTTLWPTSAGTSGDARAWRTGPAAAPSRPAMTSRRAWHAPVAYGLRRGTRGSGSGRHGVVR